jgi:hypothetical protein
MDSTVHPLLVSYQWQNRLILIFSAGIEDGGEKLRSRELLTSKRLFQTIDAMPMRQDEMKN